MIKTLKILPILAISIMAFGLTACETIEGAGKDIENAGESIQRQVNN